MNIAMRKNILVIIIIFCLTSQISLVGQVLQPEAQLSQVLEKYGQGISIEDFIESESRKLLALRSALDGSAQDTIFNLKQIRLYQFLTKFLTSTEAALPLSKLPSPELSNFAVERMVSLEAQRQTADVFYSHSKHQVTEWLAGDARVRKARGILESMELLARATRRLVVEMNVSGVEPLVNHMDDRRTEKILLGLRKVQRKARQNDLIRLQALQQPSWLGDEIASIGGELSGTYTKLMEPINKDELGDYHGHLAALVKFQTDYDRVIGQAFQWYLLHGKSIQSESLNLKNLGPVKDLQIRWESILKIYKDRFCTDAQIQAEEVLSWLQRDLKEDYFEFRLLLRDLKALDLRPGQIEPLSRVRVTEVVDSLTTEWNLFITEKGIALDTTRTSMASLVEWVLAKEAENLLAEGLARIDSVYLLPILEQVTWNLEQLDTLVLPEEKRVELSQLIGQTLNHIEQLSSIINTPPDLPGLVSERYIFKLEWEGNNKVRYAMVEKSGLAGSEDLIYQLLPTGLSTPWIEVDPTLWQLSSSDFKTQWQDVVSQTKLVVNEEVGNWLRSHGFPGTIQWEGEDVVVTGGVSFSWMDRWWKLSFDAEAAVINGDTLVFSFRDLEDKVFWQNQIENIVREEWEVGKVKLEAEVKAYLEPLLLESEKALPNLLKGFLRGDTLLYTYDLGDWSETLQGAQLLFKLHEQNWSYDYRIPPAIVLDHLSSLWPAISFENESFDTLNQETTCDWILTLRSNKPRNIGTFKIDERGAVDVVDLNEDLFDLEIGEAIGLKLKEVSYDNYAFTWNTVAFEGLPDHIEGLEELELKVGLKLQFYPSLSIEFLFDRIDRQVLLDVMIGTLNSRGLMPPGVILVDVEITPSGIYPRFVLDPAIEEDAKQRLQVLKDSLEKYPAQILKDPKIVELGKKLEDLKKDFEFVDDRMQQLQVIRDVLRDPNPDNVQRLIDLRGEDPIIDLGKDIRLVVDVRGDEIRDIEVIAPGFGCDNSEILSMAYEDGRWVPSLGSCFEDYIEAFFDGAIGDKDDLHFTYDAAANQFVLGGILKDLPLKMHIGMEGSIGWNYSEEEIAKALLEPLKDDLEVQAKEYFEELGLKATSSARELATDLLELWEGALNPLGFELDNRNQLLQQLRASADLSELYESKLTARLRATSGLLEGVVATDIMLVVKKGLVPDFSQAKANLLPVKKKIEGFASNYLTLEGDLQLDQGMILGQLQLNIPDMQRVPVPFRLRLKDGKVEATPWRELILNQVAQILNEKSLPYQLDQADVSIEVMRAQNAYPRLVLDCQMNIGSGSSLDFVIPAQMIFHLESGSFELLPTTDLKGIIAGVVGELLDLVSLPLLEGDSWIKDVSLYYGGTSQIPKGIKIVGEAPLWGVAKITLPGLILSHKGVDIGEGLGISFGEGAEVPIPPFKLIEPGGLVDGNQLLFSAKLAFEGPRTERLFYAKGSFIISLKDPRKWETRTDLVALTVFNLGYSQQKLDLDKGSYEIVVDFGGPLKEIIALEGRGLVEARGPLVLVDAEGELRIFGEHMGKGRLKVNLGDQTVLVSSEINIPVAGSVKSYFTTQRHFSNPTIAASKSLKVWKFTLSDTRFLVSPNIASAQFIVLGLSMGLQVPSYKGLDSDAFKRLLENLLSPDFDHLDEALLALLSGDITLNPFTGFGPGGGGIGGADGDGGDGGSPGASGSIRNNGYDGVTENESAASQGSTGQSASSLQSAVAAPPVELPAPTQGKTVGGGVSPALIPGDYTFPIIKSGEVSRAFQRKAGEEELPMTFVPDPVSVEGHFVSADNTTYHSAGFMLVANSSYYAHVLNQPMKGCGADGAVMHIYTGKSAQSLAHLNMPLSRLGTALDRNLCYTSLPQEISNDPLIGKWLAAFAGVVAESGSVLNTDQLIGTEEDNLFKMSSTAETIAIAVRFFNQLDHKLIVVTKDDSWVLDIPEIHLIRNNQQAQQELLALVQKHRETEVGLFEKDDQLFAYTGCDPAFKERFEYRLEGQKFIEIKADACDPPIPLPPCCPKSIEEPKPVPSPDTPLIGPGGCALQILAKGDSVEFYCGTDEAPFAVAPKTLPDGHTLFRQQSGVNWIPDTPKTMLWQMGTGHSRYVINADQSQQAVVWVGGFSIPTMSRLLLGVGDIPSWSRFGPEAFQANIALQGAFDALSRRTVSMALSGHSLKTEGIEYIENDEVVAFVVQYEGTASEEYWVFAGSKKNQRQATRKVVSAAGSPNQFKRFQNFLIEITK